MELVNALHDLAAPPHPGGQAIWGVCPKQRPDLPPLGAEIGAAVADCLAVLAVHRGPNCRGTLPCLLPGAEKRPPHDRPDDRRRAPVRLDTLESVYLGSGSCSPTSLLLHGAKQGDRRRAPHPGSLRPLQHRYTWAIGERTSANPRKGCSLPAPPSSSSFGL